MNFIDRLNGRLSQMTNSQKTVASFYLRNTNAVAFLKLEDAAMNIGVSTTTIIRFARTLGYTGYSDMQRDIQKNLIQKVGLPERLERLQKDNIPENKLLMTSMQNDIDDITQTFAGLSTELLNAVVQKLNEAETLYILGLRSSYALAHYMTSRLGQIRPHVRLVQSAGMLFPEDLVGCNEKDLCIGFFFPRYSKTTSNLLLWLKKRKVPIILFTSPNAEEVKAYGDTFLPCYLSGMSFKNSFSAPIALINYLAAATAILGHDRAIDTIEKTEDFLKNGYYLGL